MERKTATDAVLEYFKQTQTFLELKINNCRVRIRFAEGADAPSLEDSLVKIAVARNRLKT